ESSCRRRSAPASSRSAHLDREPASQVVARAGSLLLAWPSYWDEAQSWATDSPCMPPHPAREKTRRHVEHYHKHEEGQRRTPGILLQVGVRLDAVLVDHERQRCHGAPD